MDTIQRTAIVSSCGRFRYRNGRRWGDGPPLVFVSLNPSRADAEIDDPTTVRDMRFAAAHGFNAIDMVNLFAYRATDPKDLAAAGYPVGPGNDAAILDAAAGGRTVCLAWGAAAAHAVVQDRVQAVLPLLRSRHAKLKALRITKGGHPQHPLYLPASSALRDFNLETIQEAMAGAAA